jgi:hypothetical protein
MATPVNQPLTGNNDPTQGIATNPSAMDSLSQLRPLHLPEPVSWWPPAPGWWILAALFLMVLTGAIIFICRHRKNNRYRKAALNELEMIKQQYEREPLQCSQSINRLLKRIALQLWLREKIASLHGETWLKFLNAQCKTAVFSESSMRFLAENTYRPELATDHAMVECLYLETKQWIKSHRRPKTVSHSAAPENNIGESLS